MPKAPALAVARWRALTPSDLPTLLEIANTVHPGLPEDATVFAERIELFPDGCRILVAPPPPPPHLPQKQDDSNATVTVSSSSNNSSKEDALGYIISHPILKNHPPSLNSLLGSIPPPPSSLTYTVKSSFSSLADEQQQQQYYIHDLALIPNARGHGHAAGGIASVLTGPGAPALKYETTSLISVYGTAPFWRRFGFIKHLDHGDGQSNLAQKLRDYGDGAVYMVRQNVTL